MPFDTRPPRCSLVNVETGESIAEVGDTGGEGRPALYFEIRQGTGRASHPVDPARFLR